MHREESVDKSYEEARRERVKKAEAFYRNFDEVLIYMSAKLRWLSDALSRHPVNVPQPASFNETAVSVTWALQKLSTILSQRIDLVLEQASKLYSEDQPRDDHGRWVSDGASKPGKGHMNIDGAVAVLNRNADPNPPGKKLCATYVKEAIEKGGGVKLENHPRYAYQYALPREASKLPYLDNYFDRVKPTLDKYLPQKGDIAVFQPPNDKHRHGHIQMYNGTQWVSDFKQPRAFWPNKDYEDIKPPYVIYRPKDWKKPAGTPRP